MLSMTPLFMPLMMTIDPKTNTTPMKLMMNIEKNKPYESKPGIQRHRPSNKMTMKTKQTNMMEYEKNKFSL